MVQSCDKMVDCIISLEAYDRVIIINEVLIDFLNCFTFTNVTTLQYLFIYLFISVLLLCVSE